MTIIAWGNFPVNRNAVPVCTFYMPIWCQVIFKKNCKFDADMVKCIYHDIIWAKNVDLDKYMWMKNT
jgi:hypothetical protein